MSDPILDIYAGPDELPGYFSGGYFAGGYFDPLYFGGAGIVLGGDAPPTTYPDFWQALEAHLMTAVPELAGGVWAYLAPNDDPLNPDEPLPLPFAVHDQGGGAGVGRDSERTRIGSGSFVVSVYATGRAQADRLAVAVGDAMDYAPLRFESGRLLSLMHGRIYGGRLDPDPGPDGVDVYRAAVAGDYEIVSRP